MSFLNKAKQVFNPYATNYVWPPEVLNAFEDMPKDSGGRTAPIHESYVDAWRKWFKRTPKHLWNPEILRRLTELTRKSKNLSERYPNGNRQA